MLWTGCLVAAAATSPADSILRQTWLDLSQVANPAVYSLKSTSLLGTGRDSTGKQLVSLSFNKNKASFGQDVANPLDWSNYNILEMKVNNKSAQEAHFRLIVMLNNDTKDYTGSYQGSFSIPANTTKRFCFYLNLDDSIDYGMEYLRPVLSLQYDAIKNGTTVRDISHIYHWRMSYLDTAPVAIDVSEMRLIRQKMDFTGMIDAFGQYTDRAWTGKVASKTDLVNALASELLNLTPHAGTIATYGGFGPYLGDSYANGRWQITTSPSGKKYMVSPDGHEFWTMGLNCVSEGSATPVEGRESMFKSLPPQDGEFAQCYENKTTWWGPKLCFNFQKQNLMMKYGDNYLAPWMNQVKSRLDYWGINTLGIQSTPQLLDNSRPFVIILDTNGFGDRLVTPYNLWEYLPDPYDSNFAGWLAANFPAKLAPYTGMSNFMGVFVDNEMSWGTTKSDLESYNIAVGALTAPATQPAKLAFIQELQGKYASIDDLNAAWGTSFSSFDDLLNNRSWSPSAVAPGMVADFSQFCHDFAAKYYSQVRYALDASGSQALYLGSRFCGYTPDVIQGASESVDVLSFNFYRTYDKIDWAFLNSLPKPVMLSEFGYGVQTRGTFGGPGEVDSQGARQTNIKNLVNTALAQPNLVGVHMYGYGDQISSGRWADFENAGLGVVDVADNPYPEAVSAFRSVTKNMYKTRG